MNTSPPLTVAQMVERLRLTPRLAKKIKLSRVTDAEARRLLGLGNSAIKSISDYSGIAFPGYDLKGEERGAYQIRRDVPDLVNGKEKNKWMSVKGSANRYLNTTPGPLRPHATVIRVESPKSVWAIAASAERVGRKNIKVFDTNGLPGWRVRDSDDKKQPSQPNPELMLLNDYDVVDIPDSNARRRDLVWQVEQFQEHLLETVHVRSLRTVRLPQLEGVNGPDDFLQLHGDEAFWALVDAARPAWKEAFPPASDFVDLELKADLLIPHLIANGAVTVLAAASEGYKTVFAMQCSLSLLTGKPAFEHFPVESKVKGVVYCCPDMSFELLLKYARTIGLDQVPNFYIRTMKQGELLAPDHPFVKAAARDGCYLVLDTLNYFITEDNNPQVLNVFATKLRHLIDECGGPGAMLLAHPTKAGANSTDFNVTEWVSGTYAKIGTVDTIFAFRNVPVPNTECVGSVYVARLKSRPFLGVKLEPFTLAVIDGQGSLLDRGRFPVQQKPGTVRPLRELLPSKNKGGAPPDPQKEEKKQFIREHLKDQGTDKGLSWAELTKRINKTWNSAHSERTIRDWAKEVRNEDKLLEQLKKGE